MLMVKQVNEFMNKHELLKAHATVVIGVSGGPDSLALLHYFMSMQQDWDLTIIVVHVNHMFRGGESAADYDYVEQLSKQYQIPFAGTHIDVSAYQQESGLSAQAAARVCRYDFFEQVMYKYKADYLALAHHGDDQIETMLMRLVRGTYVGGLSGIPIKRPFGPGFLIRPFLVTTKQEIEAYCEQTFLAPRIDESNTQDKYVRNRFRHYLLPFIKSENKRAHERIQYLSERIKEDDVYLTQLAEDKLSEVIDEKVENKVKFSISEILSWPIPLQRRGIHLILKYLYKDHVNILTSIHIESLLKLISRQHPSGKLNFPEGLKVMKSYDHCTLTFMSNEDRSYEHRLDVPGRVSAAGLYQLTATYASDFPDSDDHHMVIKESHVTLPLIVRNRRMGDRISLKYGHKKLKDLFIDAKVPLEKRETWPIVTDASGCIVWLPLLKKAFFVPDGHGAGQYIVLKYTTDQST